MKTGVSYAFLEGLVNMKRTERVNVDTIALAIKKCIFILTGENPYQKDFHNDMEITRERAERELFYSSKSFNRIKKNNPGKFFSENCGWKTVGNDLRYLLFEGSSCFQKCNEMDYYELKDLRNATDSESGHDLI